jgi:hypothetical protein
VVTIGRGPLAVGRVMGLVIVLAAAGCGRSGIVDFEPSGGRIEFELDVSSASNNLYDTWEFCWEGALDTAQGSTPGDDDTLRTFQSIPGHQSVVLRSPPSEELRAGTWRLRLRLTGFTATGSAVRMDLSDCTNSNGDPPTVYAGETTRIVVQELGSMCEWYQTSFETAPNMGSDGIAQGCLPGVSHLALPRRIG